MNPILTTVFYFSRIFDNITNMQIKTCTNTIIDIYIYRYSIELK